MTDTVEAQEAPLNAQEWQSAVEILSRAREKIDSGWYKVDAIPGSECVSTALEKSWHELDKTLVDWDYAKLAFDTAIDAPDERELVTSNDPLATPYWGRYYMYWNDAEERTKDEVMQAFDDAIAYAENAREAALSERATGEQLIEYDIQMMDQLGLHIADEHRP